MKENKPNLPSKQITETIWKGEVKDSKGRLIRLRSPTIWDEYLLCKVMGADADNSKCLMMGEMLLKVAQIDQVVMGTPTSYNEFSANLNLLGSEGLNALIEHAQLNIIGEKEEKEEIKK